MSKSLVTESADMLCHKAEKDILTVKVLFVGEVSAGPVNQC
jgi:hypothetical protein